MQNNSISRTSSICTHEGMIVGSLPGNEPDDNFQITPKHAESENGTVKDGIINSHQQWENNSIKHKILKLFCCR
jgi:hypothetical protein